MQDMIGYGADIMGQCPPGYGGGFPQGAYYYDASNLGAPCGWPGGPQGDQAMQGPGPGMPAAVAGRADIMGYGPGPGGWGGWGPGCFGPPTAPLAIQQNQQPLIGLAPRCPQYAQTQVVGLGTACIPPCGTVTLRCSPCVLMKIIRFVIPSSVAFQVQIDQITVNGKWTLVNCGPVCGAMFTEDSTVSEMIATETIQPGCCIEIQVTNISDSDVEFCLSGLCRVVY